ncbi:MAG: Flp pilus assembly protein CpaB [Pseudomonadota bacterium]
MPKIKLPHLKKTWIVFAVAISIGLIAAIGARNYLSSEMAAIEARTKGKTINVVVAKHDILKGSKVSSENLAVRPIPADYVPSTAISPDEFDRIEGQTLAYDLKSGDMVAWSLLEDKRTPVFSSRIEAGHRAVTVPVDEINSISGMLEPGDIIDLIVTVDQNSKKVTFPLLQSIQVMATGQRATHGSEQEEARHQQYTTITLNTTFEQAKNVIAAREIGKLTALLRNPEDKHPISTAQVDLSSFLGKNSTTELPQPKTENNSSLVPVIYGGQSQTNVPKEALNLFKRHDIAPTPTTAQQENTMLSKKLNLAELARP